MEVKNHLWGSKQSNRNISTNAVSLLEEQKLTWFLHQTFSLLDLNSSLRSSGPAWRRTPLQLSSTLVLRHDCCCHRFRLETAPPSKVSLTRRGCRCHRPRQRNPVILHSSFLTATAKRVPHAAPCCTTLHLPTPQRYLITYRLKIGSSVFFVLYFKNLTPLLAVKT